MRARRSRAELEADTTKDYPHKYGSLRVITTDLIRIIEELTATK